MGDSVCCWQIVANDHGRRCDFNEIIIKKKKKKEKKEKEGKKRKKKQNSYVIRPRLSSTLQKFHLCKSFLMARNQIRRGVKKLFERIDC